jgi:hypothetical protein
MFWLVEFVDKLFRRNRKIFAQSSAGPHSVDTRTDNRRSADRDKAVFR